MAIKTTARRMASSGHGHEHISLLWWVNDQTGVTGVSNRDEMVRFVEEQGNQSVWCPDRDPLKTGQWVHVNSNGRIKYVQTVADGRWSDNLLALPLA
jgi:hypothetical protein